MRLLRFADDRSRNGQTLLLTARQLSTLDACFDPEALMKFNVLKSSISLVNHALLRDKDTLLLFCLLKDQHGLH